MFICELTGEQSGPNQKCFRLVVETREKVYLSPEGYTQGRGVEIVRELRVSEAAYHAHKNEAADRAK